jgi:ATP-dependent Clp protease ATP-binding subunit ClpC
MLQILEDGRLTDSKGRVVSFKNALIIMTSNVGSKVIEKGVSGNSLGFGGVEEDGDDADYGRLKSMVNDELKNFFRPEFLNRLDEVIVFRSLTKEEISQIAELEFKKVFKLAKEQGITLSVTEAFKAKVLEEGFDPAYGARPLRRAITRLLEDEIAESILKKAPVDGELVTVDVDDSGKVIVLRGGAPSAEEVMVLPGDAPSAEVSVLEPSEPAPELA